MFFIYFLVFTLIVAGKLLFWVTTTKVGTFKLTNCFSVTLWHAAVKRFATPGIEYSNETNKSITTISHWLRLHHQTFIFENEKLCDHDFFLENHLICNKILTFT